MPRVSLALILSISLSIPLSISPQGTASAQQTTPEIAIEAAVANLIDNPGGSREISLKDKLAASCNAKPTCSQNGSDLVDDPKFRIEVIYACRTPDGSSRQRGPVQIQGNESLKLSCVD